VRAIRGSADERSGVAARIAVTPEEVSFDATFTVRQTEFGMIEAAKKTKEEVPVTVSIRGNRK